jgi:hypothetical protein
MTCRKYIGKNVALTTITGFPIGSVAGVVAANTGMVHGNMQRDEAMVKQHQKIGLFARISLKGCKLNSMYGKLLP